MTLRRTLAISALAAAAAATAGAARGPDTGEPSLLAQATVRVEFREGKLMLSARRSAPGKVTFVVRNVGKREHELLLLRTARPPASLPVGAGRAREAGKLERIRVQPGQTRRVGLELANGGYVLLCNLPGHYRAGEFAGFRVVEAEPVARSLFRQSCGGCHTLRAAGTTGTVGPNLDELNPDVTRVARQVTNGGGVMPSFSAALTKAQIAAIASYVAEASTGGSP